MQYALFGHELDDFVDYVPSVDVDAGTPVEIVTGWWGVSSVPIPKGTTGSLRVRGAFRMLKKNSNDLFSLGDMVDYSPGEGAIAGTLWRTILRSDPGDYWVTCEINAVTGGSGDGGGEPTPLPANLMKTMGHYDPTTNGPAITDASGSLGQYYTIDAPTSDQTRNFGSGDITFKAGFAGYLMHNGTKFEHFPTGQNRKSISGRLSGAQVAANGISHAAIPAGVSGTLILAGMTWDVSELTLVAGQVSWPGTVLQTENRAQAGDPYAFIWE